MVGGLSIVPDVRSEVECGMPIPFIVKSVRGLSLKTSSKANSWSIMIHKIMFRKAKLVWSHIGKYVKGKRILDVGMGSGSISYFLNKKGFEVTSVDVANLSIYSDLKPVIYDGRRLPFKDNKFDTAIIIHVLHHCENGVDVLKEAKRVAKRVIFIEDTYRNPLEWLIIASQDALNNFELWWHKYRSVPEWKRVIKSRKWNVRAFDQWSEYFISSVYGRYCMFVVE